MNYDNHKFGVITRKWFGLTKKHGGDCASGYTFGTTDATAIAQLARWYPKGPVNIVKFGAMVLASITAGSQDYTDKITAKLLGRGGSASVMGTFSFDINGGTIAPYAIASLENLTIHQVKAGEYISIKTGTPKTGDGTAANTATTPGTVAFFVDCIAKYDPAKWDTQNYNL